MDLYRWSPSSRRVYIDVESYMKKNQCTIFKDDDGFIYYGNEYESFLEKRFSRKGLKAEYEYNDDEGRIFLWGKKMGWKVI